MRYPFFLFTFVMKLRIILLESTHKGLNLYGC